MASSRLLLISLALLYIGNEAAAGVVDNFNDGLKLAGQMFGINTASDVANLVAKAFSNAATRAKPDLMSMLQQRFTQGQQTEHEQEPSSEGSEPENAQETPPLQEEQQQSQEHESNRQSNRRPEAQLGEFNTGQMLTNMLRMVGFDARKLGALAINALVMIAQAIGNSVMQAARTGGNIFGSVPPPSHSGPEAIYEPSEHQPRSLPGSTPIDWFLQRPGRQTQRMLRQIMDRELPEQIVDMIEKHEIDGQGDAACLKLLMCKSSPIIWGMQKSLRKRLNINTDVGPMAEEEDQKHEGRRHFDTDVFFKHLPSLDEFRAHGVTCETRYANYCTRNATKPEQ